MLREISCVALQLLPLPKLVPAMAVLLLGASQLLQLSCAALAAQPAPSLQVAALPLPLWVVNVSGLAPNLLPLFATAQGALNRRNDGDAARVLLVGIPARTAAATHPLASRSTRSASFFNACSAG